MVRIRLVGVWIVSAVACTFLGVFVRSVVLLQLIAVALATCRFFNAVES